jgi:hypothetical protein
MTGLIQGLGGQVDVGCSARSLARIHSKGGCFNDVLFSFEVNIVIVSMFSPPWKTKILERLEELGGLCVNLKFFDALD